MLMAFTLVFAIFAYELFSVQWWNADELSQQALTQFERYWNHRLARRGHCCDTPESLDALRRRLDEDARSGEAQPYLERVRASLERDILHGYAALLPTQDVEDAADPPDKATGEEVPGRLVTAIDAAATPHRSRRRPTPASDDTDVLGVRTTVIDLLPTRIADRVSVVVLLGLLLQM